jgi:hypothetical protein
MFVTAGVERTDHGDLRGRRVDGDEHGVDGGGVAGRSVQHAGRRVERETSDWVVDQQRVVERPDVRDDGTGGGVEGVQLARRARGGRCVNDAGCAVVADSASTTAAQNARTNARMLSLRLSLKALYNRK